MDVIQLVVTVVPNLLFAAIYVTATGRWIDRGLTSLESRVAFLEKALTECLGQRVIVKGEERSAP